MYKSQERAGQDVDYIIVRYKRDNVFKKTKKRRIFIVTICALRRVYIHVYTNAWRIIKKEDPN